MKLSSLAQKRIIAGMAALIVVVAFYFYNNTSIQRQLAPIKVVYAKEDIPPHTKIEANMVFERVVPSQSIPPNAVTSVNEVIGKWTVDGYGITKNSLVYKGKVLETNDMPDSAILNLNEDEYAFPLLVDIETSSGNAIMPNSYVDLYFATDKTESKKPFTGKLFERIRVTSVKDSKTQNVFSAENYTESSQQGNEQKSSNQIASSTSNTNTIAKLYTLAVTEEQLDLLTKAKILGNIIPVANGRSYDEIASNDKEDATANQVYEYINDNSYNETTASNDDTAGFDEETVDQKESDPKNTEKVAKSETKEKANGN
ncbi:Flp pilus assembly protein CpaB [Heyndrickxia oleronia]|uniref:RcpC/CpaB family pilus assembly protein n=1 Tax=Heyndrickxia oleronia TaxID=38875 RepID=A0AAW6T524_9BACI|nr:RcpC/CpaB family pilus assembly protein [Heyndrickxia oleronia]MDH5163386.1 RcpC/CpaB family pilus assembly protein [Heyndrickxia oleronia]